jgi:hypothetical protein
MYQKERKKESERGRERERNIKLTTKKVSQCLLFPISARYHDGMENGNDID